MPLKQQEVSRPASISSRWRDLVVILLWLAGTSACLYLFWRDLNMTFTRLYEEPVGVITFKYKAAQRRLEDRVVWDRLQTSSPVYNGDFIRTADLSEATITFTKGGAAIDLAENCLIQIRVEDSGPAVALTEGDLCVAAREDSSVTLSSGGALVEVGPGALVSASADAGNFDMSVVEGSAIVTSAAGIQKADAGEIFALGGGALPEPRVVVVSPRPSARLLVPQDTAVPIGFSWRAHNFTNEDSACVEISENRSFSPILIRQTGTDPGAAISMSLSPGTYFWRAYAVREGIASPAFRTSSGKLTIIHAPAPRTIAPPEDSVHRFRKLFPAVRFQWTKEEYAALYNFEAADNPGMNDPVLQMRTQGTSFVSSELGAGRWYWRVTPVFSDSFEGTALPSETASFVIEASGVLEAPRLQAPADASGVNIAREREDLYFSWYPDNEAVSYTIQISAQADLSDPLISETVRDSFFVYGQRETVLRSGQYYWGVFLTDSEGVSSAVSPLRSFLAHEDSTAPRTVFPPDNYTVADTLVRDIRFAWKSNLPSAPRFQISSAADFSRLVVDEESAAGNARGRNLPVGIYYWRLSLRTGDKESFETPAKRLNVVPPFAEPVLENPLPGARVEIGGDAVMGFRWQAVEGAQYYHFRLYSGDSRRPVYEDAFCQTTAKTLTMESYPEGAFVWTVQAFADEGPLRSRRAGLLAAGRFAMRRLELVSLDYPPPGHAYGGLEALRRPGELRWSSSLASKSRLLVSRNPNPLAGPPVMDIRNPQKTIPLIRLPEGDYYWTVLAETADGFDLNAKTPSFFRVLPTPLLPAPEGRSPEDGYLIDAPRLRENRRLRFSWQPVAGANGYIFSLFHEEGGTRQQVFSSEQNAAAFILEDLRPLLAQGDFLWQVEAICRAADGFMEQRGIPGENRFRVEVPVPGGAARAKVPGVLYGPAGE